MANEKILIIEDDKEVSEFCQDVLNAEEYETIVATTGEDGLKMLSESYYDLAIVDLKLPGMDGIEVLKEIRKKSENTSVIIFSGFGKIEQAVEAMKLGAYDYLTKPFSVDELRLNVKRCFEQQRLHTEVGGLRNIKTLYKVSIMMSSLMEVDKVLDLILKIACDIVKADSGSLMLIDEKNHELTIGVAMGMPEDVAKTVRVKVGERVSGWVAKTGEPLLLIDGLNKQPQFKDLETNPTIKSAICVPLKTKDKIVGVLNVSNKGSAYVFTKTDLALLKEVADDAAVAIENAKVYERLKELDKLKSEFISVVSHELRTPLTVIISAVENLSDGIFGNLSDAQLKWVKEIGNSASRLNQLISDILDISKLESGQIEIRREKNKINDLIRKIVAQMTALAKKKDILLKFSLPSQPLFVMIDPRRIEQVLINLIDNAIKFTPAGGTIEVSAEPVDDEVEVVTADTGIGIQPEHLGIIFDRFQQIKRSSYSGLHGVGLGLAIVKEIVTQHEGRVWVESKPGEGSRFIFTLPWGKDDGEKKHAE